MADKQAAFQIHSQDNVATALQALEPGAVGLRGEGSGEIQAVEPIPRGHKIALRDLQPGEPVIKYGVPIGLTTALVAKGSWVHLHCMRSAYDERSSHLDAVTGAPLDTRYE